MSQVQSLNCDPCDQRRDLRNYNADLRGAVQMHYHDLAIDFKMLENKLNEQPISGITISVKENRIIVAFYYRPKEDVEKGDALLQHKHGDNDPMEREFMHISFFPKGEGGVHSTIPSSKASKDHLFLTNEHILTCLGHGERYYTLSNYFKTLAHYFNTETPITRPGEELAPYIKEFINSCLDRKLYPEYRSKEPSREEKKRQLVDLLTQLHDSVKELCRDGDRDRDRAREARVLQRDVVMGEGVGSIREGAAEMDEDGWVGETKRGVGVTKRESVRQANRFHPHNRSTGSAAGTKRASGGGSTKVVLYSGKIQKLRELNKKLRKHKTKNKTKIEKNNKKIDELKIKIKKEKAKAKEKLKKQKAKAKEKLKKEKAKAKEKLKKEKEKLKKQKTKKVHITKKIKK